MWTIEFPAHSVGQAQDIVRQHVAAGSAVPSVTVAGRLGFMLATCDYRLVEAVSAHVGGNAIVSKS